VDPRGKGVTIKDLTFSPAGNLGFRNGRGQISSSARPSGRAVESRPRSRHEPPGDYNAPMTTANHLSVHLDSPSGRSPRSTPSRTVHIVDAESIRGEFTHRRRVRISIVTISKCPRLCIPDDPLRRLVRNIRVPANGRLVVAKAIPCRGPDPRYVRSASVSSR
jgi:hypothetical protein